MDTLMLILDPSVITQSTGVVEYTDCFSAKE